MNQSDLEARNPAAAEQMSEHEAEYEHDRAMYFLQQELDVIQAKHPQFTAAEVLALYHAQLNELDQDYT